VLFNDAAPDTDSVEFGIVLGAGPLLLLHDPEIEIPDLLTAQVYALIREEVGRGAEDLIHVVLGDDPDQGAVYVEGDRPDARACLCRG
jgi:hypothetical protein